MFLVEQFFSEHIFSFLSVMFTVNTGVLESNFWN